jgi:glycosyltransferase involved in cell wall biosynthesis
VTAAPRPPSGESRRRSLRHAAARMVRRFLGTDGLPDWQRTVQSALEGLAAIATRDHARVDPLARAVAVFTFDAWLALEQPETDVTISVVMATRNRCGHLRAAIDSVRSQRHERWELIVVDDGSTDDTPHLLAQIEDPRIRALHLDHRGVCAARNAGLSAVTGDIVTYLDDDNLMHPGWLQAVAWAFERSPDTQVLYGARIIDDEDAVLDGASGGLPFVLFVAFDRADLAHGNLADMNVMAHRTGHGEGRFDESLSEYGDWDLFARLTEHDDPLELPAIGCLYRTTTSDRLSDRPQHLRQEEYRRVARLIAERRAGINPSAVRPPDSCGSDR